MKKILLIATLLTSILPGQSIAQEYYYECTNSTTNAKVTCTPTVENNECDDYLSASDLNCVLIDPTKKEASNNVTTSSLFSSTGGRFIPEACTGKSNSLQTCGVNEVLVVVINVSRFILGMIGSIALLMFIYGGVTFLVSSGNSQQVEAGKTILKNAVIGIMITFFAWISIGLLITALTGGTIGNPLLFEDKTPFTVDVPSSNNTNRTPAPILTPQERQEVLEIQEPEAPDPSDPI